MIDGFQAQHKNCTVIDSDGAGDMLCDRCSSLHQKYKEFNRYYMLKNNLIICFIRGNHYKNQSKITFNFTGLTTETIEKNTTIYLYVFLISS